MDGNFDIYSILGKLIKVESYINQFMLTQKNMRKQNSTGFINMEMAN